MNVLLRAFFNITHAGTGDSSALTLPNPLGSADFGELVKKILGAAFGISIPIVTGMVLWGGFQILTSRGDEKQLIAGKNTILYAVIGFAVIIIAQGITQIIQSFFAS